MSKDEDAVTIACDRIVFVDDKGTTYVFPTEEAAEAFAEDCGTNGLCCMTLQSNGKHASAAIRTRADRALADRLYTKYATQ